MKLENRNDSDIIATINSLKLDDDSNDYNMLIDEVYIDNIIEPSDHSTYCFFNWSNDLKFNADFSSEMNILNQKSKEEMDKQGDQFIELLENTKFEDGMDNEATDFFNEWMQTNKVVALQWLTNLYNESIINSKPNITLKILALLADYDIEETKPNGQLMVATGLTNQNIFIQSKALNVIGHWMDYGTLEMVSNLSITTPWLKMKLDKIKGKIEKKHASKGI